MTHLDMFADPKSTPPPVIVPEAPAAAAITNSAVTIMQGWIKTPRYLRGTTSLPTLVRVNGDDHEYAPAAFALAEGCTLGVWPSRDACVLAPDGERLTLYDALGARLATALP